jgi:arginyl-tRNA synthetase
MKKLHDPYRNQVAALLKAAAEPLFSMNDSFLDEGVFSEHLAGPPNPQLGDFAFGCFILAKNLKKAPPIVAQELKSQLEKSSQASSIFESVQCAGPYLNLKLKLNYLGENLLQEILKGNYFKTRLIEQSPKTMIEYSQPNTHKEIHVGHMRNASLGDALVRLQRYIGIDVISSTFPGDVGTHVAKCLWYLKFHNTEPIPSEKKGEWLGKIYSRANTKFEDELGTEQEQKNREQLTLILKQLEEGCGEYFDLWKETRQWSIDLMNQVYAWAGISFDRWYWESEVDADSVRYVKQLFAEGKLIQSQGAVGMDLEAEGLGFCLLLKSDGNGLYATKDLELARRKFQDFGIEKNIYVVDIRQALHFKQVFKSLEKLGFPQAKDCFHLQYNFVELPDGAMSSRKGNIVPLMELVEKMQAQVQSQYLSRYQDWSEEEKSLVAKQVAQGAIKYGMLRMDTNKKIVFDMNEWLKIEGESGPFIQYSCARINSLIEKFKVDSLEKSSWELLSHPAERAVIQHLMHFHQIVVSAALNYKPNLLCTYLFEGAQKFNHFYHECSIGNAETADLRKARLALSQCMGLTLSKGLELLGIPTPKRM